MKITREKASQRLHHRIKTPLKIVIEGQEYSAIDWGLGGFHIENWFKSSSITAEDDVFCCNFELPFQGFSIGFDVAVKQVRFDQHSHHASFCFIEPSERQLELMSHFIEQLVRGSMVSVQDTILRIDSPVTPVSTEPDPSPVSEVSSRGISLKKIIMSTVYLIVGLTLFVLVATTIYENFLSLTVKNAVVFAPVEPVISLVDGRIKSVSRNINQDIGAGESLFVIDSPKLKRALKKAKIRVENKKLELEERRKKYALEIESSGNPASKKSRLYEIEIDRIEQEVALATQNQVALYEFKDKLAINSPSPGRIVRLLRGEGSIVMRGDTLALFQRKNHPIVHAYIYHHQSLDIQLSQQVTVRAGSRQWLGIVSDIQNRSAELFKHSAYTADITSGKNTLVEIEVYSLNNHASPAPRAGMSVEVIFPYFNNDALLYRLIDSISSNKPAPPSPNEDQRLNSQELSL